MLARVAFLHTTDERFLVLSEINARSPESRRPRFSLTTFDHENTFLKLAATAGLNPEVTTDIIAAVLLSVAQPSFPHRWIDLDLSQYETANLGLYGESVEAEFISSSDAEEGAVDEPENILGGGGKQFFDFLMQAPAPFIILSGPEHRVSFINPPYLRLVGRTSYESVMHRTVREVFPELEGKPFFGLLDQVYETGESYVGIEALVRLASEVTGELEDTYLDFIYHALRDAAGGIAGIMIQATDVTERVVSRAVVDSRVNAIYKQWLELEAIYNTAPVGVILVDAIDLCILRINELQAEFLGGTAAEFQGKRLEEVDFKVPAFKVLLDQVVSGKQVRNTVIETAVLVPAVKSRSWLVNITPFLDDAGKIERLCAISLEMPSEYWPQKTAAKVEEEAGSLE